MKYFILSLFLSIFSINYAQLYVPVDTLHNKRDNLTVYFENRTDQLVAYFKGKDYYDRKVLKNFKKQRNQSIQGILDGSYLFFNIEIEQYVNDLLREIATKNEIDTTNLRIFLSRDTQPNAMSLGDGNFIFTISLLNRLDNEDELKFIIAHELAHYQLKHLEQKIQNRIVYLDSDSYKKSKKASKSKRNAFSKSLGFIKDYQYENKLSQRKNEIAADSLGYLLFKNTAQNKNQAIIALSKLDTLNPSEIEELNLNDFKKHFCAPDLPFNKDWTVGFDFSKYNYKRGDVDLFGFHKDSLRTHPQITKRINNLLLNNPELKKTNDNSINRIRFNEEFLMEDVYAHYCSKEFGRGIYLIFQLQKHKILSIREKEFLKYMLVLFYNEIYEAKKSLETKKYVDEVNVVEFSDQYNLFLTILNQLRSSEVKKIINKYQI